MSIFSSISKKEKIWLALSFLIVLFAFSDRLILAPISLKFKRINSVIRMREAQLAQSMHNLNSKDEIAREYEKYLPYIKSDYSEEEEVAKLLEEIENLGRNAGISITDIKPQSSKQISIYKYYVVEIEAEGRMEALTTFLYQLGTSKQLFRASKVYISVKDKETSTAKASMLITKVVLAGKN